MSEEAPEIIKIDKKNEKCRKTLGDDKIFRFECEHIDEKLRLSLKEINAYSPYYYEAFYEKEELNKWKSLFKAIEKIDELIEQLLKLFEKKETILKEVDNGKKISICFKVPNFAEIFDVKFDLERKTIENKDDGLMLLFEIQKDNLKIINEIKEQCKNNQNDSLSKEILDLFPIEP